MTELQMVTVPNEEESESLYKLCIISIEGKKFVQNLPGSCSFADLYARASQDLRLLPATFDLVFQPPAGGECLLEHEASPRLSSLPLVDGLNRLQVKERDDGPPEKMPDDKTNSNKRPLTETDRVGATTPIAKEEEDRFGKSSTGYVGLCNQGATCYLNSLLQTLFMTPEFRRAIYSRERPTDPKSCVISTELQRLFLLLEASKDRAVETTSITKSFGWDHSEAFEQHDVQELLRLLFDALEKEWKSDLLQKLYEGRLEDYVECKVCNHKSARTDKYMDIPLVLKPFGSTVVHKSVEEALEKFTEVENLYGDNQYFCEKCNKKVDALKGLKFVSFPYFLTLQLKRFDFDPETFRRIKLNEQFTFPFDLDMSPYLAEGVVSPDPLQYRLFSVMIHSGSALGGHYYAYILSFEQDKWFCFNDSSVREISQTEVEAAFGTVSARTAYSSYSGSTSAYMLIYRRMDPAANKLPFSEADMPAHINALKEAVLKEETDRLEEERRKRDMVELTVYYSPTPNSEPEKRTLLTNMKHTLEEVHLEVLKLYELDPATVTSRLRKQNYTGGSIESFSDEDLAQELEKVCLKFKPLVLQTAGPDGTFPEISASDRPVTVIYYDIDSRELGLAQRVFVNEAGTIGMLRIAAGQLFGVDPADLGIVKTTHSMTYQMDNDSISLNLSYSTPGATKYYMCNKNAPVGLTPAPSSTMSPDTVLSTDSGGDEAGAGDADPPPAYDAQLTAMDLLLEAVEIQTYTLSIIVIPPDQKQDSQGITVLVDGRMLIGDMKERFLVPIAELPSTDFQIFRCTYSNTEYELHQLESSVKSTISNNDRILLRRGKALKAGEQMVAFHLLNEETFDTELLTEFGVANNTLISDVKAMLVERVQKLAADDPKWKFKDLKLTADRFRLRDMSYSTNTALIDSKPMELNWKKTVCVQRLSGPEKKVSDRQVSVFLRRFEPDTLTVRGLEEIILPADMATYDGSPLAVTDVVAAISECSGLPVENIEVARFFGSFPFHADAIECTRTSTTWVKSSMALMREQPTLITYDGHCLLYKDATLPVGELTEEIKDKIAKESAARARKQTAQYRRKEATLRIKTSSDSETGPAVRAKANVGSSMAVDDAANKATPESSPKER